MRGQFTAIVEPSDDGYVARCAEVPGTEVEAGSPAEALENLADAITIVFEVNREEVEEESGPLATKHMIEVDLKHSRLLESDLG